MRVESTRPMRDGGWFHEFGDKPKPAFAPKPPTPKLNMDMESVYDALPVCSIEPLAKQLGVSLIALESLGITRKGNSWAVPMRDGKNKIIGIHLRCDDGTKRAVVGSRNGLFIPQIEPQKTAYICEGMSNAASLISMGLYAIGRPSCNTGAEQLKEALTRLGVHRIVIVCDADEIKFGGKRPGYSGAIKLKKDLGLMSVTFVPPSPLKDVRDMIKKLGAESSLHVINSSVDHKIWIRV
jgi:phage/plasmid primase-like uncharacterized protein